MKCGEDMCCVVVVLQKIHLNTQLDERERRRWATDLDVCKRSSECPYTVSFYGALVYEVGGAEECVLWACCVAAT